jgi:hypothetical protein
MSYFAQIDENNIVTDVISAEQDFIDTLPNPSSWIKTSYNTKGGVHYGADGNPDGGIALRKNFAGIGFLYNQTLDAFIPKSQFPSWILVEDSCTWHPPVPYPNDGKLYMWNESIINWIEVT